MHKLRSMTETIKMLSKENEALVTKNNQLRQYKTMNETNSGTNKFNLAMINVVKENWHSTHR